MTSPGGSKPDLELEDVIAQREFELVTESGTRFVAVRIARPKYVSDDLGYVCILEISGLGEEVFLEAAPGVDSLQALLLAISVATSALQSSHAYREGRLSFLGQPFLFLPVTTLDSPAKARPAARPR